MFVLVILAIIMTEDGPKPITRPNIEYYITKEDCNKYGGKHIQEFVASLGTEPALLAAKCVQVKEMEGNPA